MTIQKPEPYCWAVEWTNSVWAFRGENAEELAHSCFPEKPPFLLYREPPAHHFANAGKVMPIGTARELLSCAALEILGLKPSTKLYVMPEAPETPVTEESSAAQQGLTDEEIEAIINDIWGSASIAPQSAVSFAKAIEAKLKEKKRAFCTELWTTHDGKVIPIKDVGDKDLFNAYRHTQNSLLFPEMVLRLFEAKLKTEELTAKTLQRYGGGIMDCDYIGRGEHAFAKAIEAKLKEKNK